MSDSDSDDLSTPANLPTDAAIEQCLRRVVRDAIKKSEDITINLARSRAEKELGLDAGFFKDNEVWKKRSKDVINQAVDEPESPEKPKAAVKAPAKAGTKRKSDETQPKRKRVRKSPVVDSEDRDMSDGDAEVRNHVSDDGEVKKGKAQPKSEEESALSSPPEDESEPAELKRNGKTLEDDESELSDVIDDAPPKKSREKKKSTSPTATKSNPAKSSKSKSTTTAANEQQRSKSTSTSKDKDKSLTPDEEQIKSLQSWLLKCGIRKVWHRELAPYPTPKEKISHLKKMLDDVGMSGRYSVEKARQIKEARELAEELEAARKFNEQWGHGEGSGDEGEGAEEKPVPKRARPKGLVDFGDSDEESD